MNPQESPLFRALSVRLQGQDADDVLQMLSTTKNFMHGFGLLILRRGPNWQMQWRRPVQFVLERPLMQCSTPMACKVLK